MPVFLDYHPIPELPTDLVHRVLTEARRRGYDRAGVRYLDLYCGHDDRVYCVVEAPNQHAVQMAHADLGLPCREVRLVAGVDAQRPRSTDQEVIRRAIMDFAAETAMAELLED